MLTKMLEKKAAFYFLLTFSKLFKLSVVHNSKTNLLMFRIFF
jgi:hypothetical protein